MNFIGNKLIHAALLAATVSVVATAPAQALNLKGSLGFVGGVDITSTGDGDDFDFAFLNPSVILRAEDDFAPAGDSIDFTNFSIVDAGIGGTIDPFITGIASSKGDVNFVLENIGSFMNNGSTIEFTLAGYFTDGAGNFGGTGTFSGDFDITTGTFSGGLTAVPTPAAVLPVVAGLFGAASRKKQEEEA
ncbi:PTPA-CTERM sorting domain-containing protein [[Limnothrix rosea] IAM M-220]|uniref:PTPA-CTERM sorting domain-containing protein n=1 Tax=[Limnothrix rosea] IAM M-220 TaxID=454133 RepID=UPI000963ED48|nr:PTPA-CTERM sorting domain-containing protein [[Limnothrix rosea] IAM M-220]OKH10831.1 hypothetical protein NIES208_18125 [[Limnothrix rosea] IAM M-220]